MEGLKDDNAKLQRLIKENTKQLGLVGEFKAANEQLRHAEKRMRDEIVSLSDKLRISRQDGQRKESMISELRDRIN